MNRTEISKLLGATWKTLPEEEKKVYLTEFEKLKEQYDLELAEYEKGKHKPTNNNDSDLSEEDESDEEN